MRKVFHSIHSIFALIDSLLFSNQQNQIQSKWVIAFDCWGVVYENVYQVFLDQHEKQLRNFLEVRKDLPNRELGYPNYYMDLADKIDHQKITDDEFYGVLSQATGESCQSIKQKMNDVICLHREILEFIKELKKQGHQVILVANADRDFLQKFLDHEAVGTFVDRVFTSSQTKARKSDIGFWKTVSTSLNVPFGNIILIDDSPTAVAKVQALGIKSILYDGNNKHLKEALHDMLKNK